MAEFKVGIGVDDGKSLRATDNILPDVEKTPEGSNTTHENSARMSDETKNRLRELGCRVFSLGKTPREKIDQWVRYFAGSMSEKNINLLVQNWPQNCDIAVLPGLFLEGSNETPPEGSALSPLEIGKMKLVGARDELSRKYQGTSPIIGEAAQYLALEALERETSGKSLFEKVILRTGTVEIDNKNRLGEDDPRDFVFFNGDVLDRPSSKYTDEDFYVVPLLIPHSSPETVQ